MAAAPLQPPLFPVRVYLQKTVPEASQKRFYAMTAIPTLFGEWAVIREWGQIGSPGTVRVDLHDDKGQAVTALAEITRKKVKRGYRGA